MEQCQTILIDCVCDIIIIIRVGCGYLWNGLLEMQKR